MNTGRSASPCVILTSTVAVDGVPYVGRSETHLRLRDYEEAWHRWLSNPCVTRIVLVENSGFDLAQFRNLAERVNAGTKEVEFISFVADRGTRGRGKGYGETLALMRAVESSHLLSDAGRFVKISGRYYVSNVQLIMERVATNVDVVCDLRKNLTWADSRVFGGTFEFLRDYVCREGQHVDDGAGVYIEHALARAAHRAMADGRRWSLLPCAPTVLGISGTSDTSYPNSWYRRTARSMFHLAKSRLLSR